MCLGNGAIFVAEPTRMLGAAIVRALERQGLGHQVLHPQGLDLACEGEVRAFFDAHKPRIVFLGAGITGGISAAQQFPGQMMLSNLRVATNVISSAHEAGVEKLLYLGSSCMYPRDATQPMSEDLLLHGPLEPTCDAYALAKLAGVKLVQAYRQEYGSSFIAAIPTNIFGPCDDFDPRTSHVIAGMMSRMHQAKLEGHSEFSIWGTGAATREFLYADDLAEACLFLMEHYDDNAPINIGAGENVSIAELARDLKSVLGFEGELTCDTSKPDGAPGKALDGTKLSELGWKPQMPFQKGLKHTYDWFRTAPDEYLSNPLGTRMGNK